MTVYIDSDYVCHKENATGRRAVESTFFDGKPDVVIESYRFVPSGESWTRPDGEQFFGEMVCPATVIEPVSSAQTAYTQAKDEELLVEAELIDTITELCEEIIG